MVILGVCDIGHRIGFDDACRLVERYWELGGREFDTAHTYAHWVPGMLGASERVLGRALRTVGLPPSEVRITTKGGHPDGGALYPRPARYLDPDLVRRDLDESLERIGTECVDAFLLHRDDPSAPVDEIAALLQSIRASGRANRIGVSNWSLPRIMGLRARLDGDLVWQNQCSLAAPKWTEGPDPSMRRFRSWDFAWAAGSHVTCTCYSATANGYFATDGSSPTFDNATSVERLGRACAMAAEKATTPNRLALAWLLAQAGDVRAIVGTTSIDHLEDAMGAPGVAMTPAERDGLGVA